MIFILRIFEANKYEMVEARWHGKPRMVRLCDHDKEKYEVRIRLVLYYKTTFFTTHTHAHSKVRNEEQKTDQNDRNDQTTDCSFHFIPGLQSKSSLATRWAFLLFRPRPFRAVVYVPAPLTDPYLPIHRRVRVRRKSIRGRSRPLFRFRHS